MSILNDEFLRILDDGTRGGVNVVRDFADVKEAKDTIQTNFSLKYVIEHETRSKQGISLTWASVMSA